LRHGARNERSIAYRAMCSATSHAGHSRNRRKHLRARNIRACERQSRCRSHSRVAAHRSRPSSRTYFLCAVSRNRNGTGFR
jgi:hypothetical protein